MANTTPSTLEILIDIRARLDALNATQNGLKGVAEDVRDVQESASELGSLFAQGLGIGTGMELARRAVDLFKSSFTEAVRISSQLASEVERAHGRLGLSGEAYQTLAAEARAAGTEFSEIMSSTAQFRSQLGSALLDPSKPTVIRQLALDAQTLASMPLERQIEQVAIALGKISDGNVRARLTQELFGRGAAAMAPLLERLRAQGYDKLRESALATNAVLGDGMAEAINKANNAADAAQKKLGVALAPLNLKLIEAKTQVVTFLAKNAGTIQSSVEASFVGAFASAIANAMEKGAASVEKMGGWKAAFSKLGTLAAGPFGVGFAVAVGTVIIKELERRALEAHARSDAMSERAFRGPHDVQMAIPSLTNEDELRALYNRAVERNNAAIAEREKLIQTPMLNDEQREAITLLDQELQRWSGLIPLIKQSGQAAIERNRAAKIDFIEINKLQLANLKLDMDHELFQSKLYIPDEEKRAAELKYLDAKAQNLAKIRTLTEKLPATALTPEDRAKQIAQLQHEVDMLISRSGAVGLPKSDARKIGDDYRLFKTGNNADGSGRLKAMQGAEAGASQWVMGLGTQGEQIAAGLQSTLGATVNSISEGIYGWATGAQSLGDTVRNLQGTVFKTLLDTIVQMGAQWLVSAALAKSSMIGTFLLGVGLRKAEAADTVATETAKTPSLATNAALASAGSFGMSAVLGIALLAALVGAFAAGGFADGGYTGHGAKYEPAGVVHRGEDVWSQADIARMGGIGNVEALRLGGQDALESLPVPAPARIQPVEAGSLSLSSAIAANAAAAPQPMPPLIAFAENYTDIRKLKRQVGWDRAIVQTVKDNLGEIMS